MPSLKVDLCIAITIEKRVSKKKMKAKEIQTAETFFSLIEEGKVAEVVHLFSDDLQVRNRITSGFDISFTDYNAIQFEGLLLFTTPDPDLVLAEYRLKAIVEETGEPYKGEHLAVFKFKEGKMRVLSS